MIDLKGSAALVSGGSRGIGAAVCQLLAEAGADVAVAYHRDSEEAERVVTKIQDMGQRGLAIAGDLSDPTATAEVFQTAVASLGKLDIVVANAGIWERAAIDQMTDEQWHRTMKTNLDSLFFTCREASRLMKAQKSGKLILIASTAGQRGEAHYSHYAASKGAAIAMTRSLAAELGPANINVNCVAPGWVHTDMTQAIFADPAYHMQVCQSIPLQRIADPSDVAGPVLFLASELARHIQGAVINVNGGSVLC